MAHAPSQAGVAVRPAIGTYDVDPAHTTVEFVARHILTKVRGRFTGFTGTIHVADDPTRSSIQAEIEAASIDTSEPRRDEHLRSDDFFSVEKFPALRFTSKEIRPRGGDRYDVVGDLTIRDVTREIVLEAGYLGAGLDPWGGERLAFSASTNVNREDFGLTWNLALETGGFLVGKDVALEIQVSAVRRAEP